MQYRAPPPACSANSGSNSTSSRGSVAYEQSRVHLRTYFHLTHVFWSRHRVAGCGNTGVASVKAFQQGGGSPLGHSVSGGTASGAMARGSSREGHGSAIAAAPGPRAGRAASPGGGGEERFSRARSARSAEVLRLLPAYHCNTPGAQPAKSLSLSVGMSFFVLMHTVLSFGICQGMSWQHLNQPCLAR